MLHVLGITSLHCVYKGSVVGRGSYGWHAGLIYGYSCLYPINRFDCCFLLKHTLRRKDVTKKNPFINLLTFQLCRFIAFSHLDTRFLLFFTSVTFPGENFASSLLSKTQIFQKNLENTSNSEFAAFSRSFHVREFYLRGGLQSV